MRRRRAFDRPRAATFHATVQKVSGGMTRMCLHISPKFHLAVRPISIYLSSMFGYHADLMRPVTHYEHYHHTDRHEASWMDILNYLPDGHGSDSDDPPLIRR
jgi:hypothetical protein